MSTETEDAVEQAQAAEARGDISAAQDWLDRAHRLSPHDPTVTLLLGLHCLKHAPERAEALLADIAEQAELAEIWLALAARRTGATRRDTLAHLLRHFTLPADTTQISQLADGQPWCGLAWDDAHGLTWVASGADCAAFADGKRLKSNVIPPDARVLRVRNAAGDVLASPLKLARFHHLQACVWADPEGLVGWAWYPATPQRVARLTIADGHSVVADQPITPPAPLSLARGFRVPARDCSGLMRITDEAGREITGSPLRLRLKPQSAPGVSPAPARSDPNRPVAVVVPVYRDRKLTKACLAAVFASAPTALVIVVDDATPEPKLARDLDRLAQAGRITLIRHNRNRGFPASANAGLRAALALETQHDVVLLNADAIVPHSQGPSWLDRLRAVVHADGWIGSATPLSNNASLLSYPARDGENAASDRAALQRLDKLAARANPGVAVDIPTGVGFCLYLRHEMLRDVGLLREDAFAQGYGEENDFCRRASARGWRNVACPGVFVAHHGAASFGAARHALMRRNIAVLEQLHPGYGNLVTAWAGRDPAEDPLAPSRRKLDEARWQKTATPSTTLIITHASGGGVERSVQSRVAELGEHGAILLRPIPVPGDDDGAHLPGFCRVEDSTHPADFPNLVYRLPDEFPHLLTLLRRRRPVAVELHHRLGHAPQIAELAERLKLPLDITLHDCSAFCPRVTLLGPDGRYCGEPTEIASCEACIAKVGARNGEEIGVAALRQRSAREFAHARSVKLPSPDMARRIRRHFGTVTPQIIALEDDAAITPPTRRWESGDLIVAVIGALGIDKGMNVLLACAEDAASRDLPLRFRLVGHSENDSALHATGRVFTTGRFAEADGEALVRAQGAHLAFLPSVVPESWGYALSLAWRAGLRAVVFDLGAQAQRMHQTGFGWTLPLGLPAETINNALLDRGKP